MCYTCLVVHIHVRYMYRVPGHGYTNVPLTDHDGSGDATPPPAYNPDVSGAEGIVYQPNVNNGNNNLNPHCANYNYAAPVSQLQPQLQSPNTQKPVRPALPRGAPLGAQNHLPADNMYPGQAHYINNQLQQPAQVCSAPQQPVARFSNQNYNQQQQHHQQPQQYHNQQPYNYNEILIQTVMSCICCCCPIGMAGVYYAQRGHDEYRRGNFEQAFTYRRQAVRAAQLACIVGLLFYLISILL